LEERLLQPLIDETGLTRERTPLEAFSILPEDQQQLIIDLRGIHGRRRLPSLVVVTDKVANYPFKEAFLMRIPAAVMQDTDMDGSFIS